MMSKAEWRLVYNQDCTNLFGYIREPITAQHVDRMVDEAADAGVDLFLVNPNAQRVNYPSCVWQTFWDGYVPGDRSFFGPVPDEALPGRERWVSQMRHLAESSCDYLARSLERCRTRGVTPGVSIRMNDMHDVPWPKSHLFSRFYIDHPEWHLQNPPVSGWAATGLNFFHAPVREHYLTLVRELCQRYYFDVLELDFLRFHCYFPFGEGRLHAPIMTEFLREVRRELAATGRRMALMPRVAATPVVALELGCDVAAWAREGLIDGLAFGAFFTMAWNRPIAAFREAVGSDVALYPSSEAFVDSREGMSRRVLPTDPAWIRGFAAASFAGGADGIYLFNFFVPRDINASEPLCFDALPSLRNADSLRGLPKKYTLSSTVTSAEADGPMQVPVDIPSHQERSFDMMMASELAGITATLHLFIRRPAAGLRVFLNGGLLGAPRATLVHPEGAGGQAVCHELVFALNTAFVRDGGNQFVVRTGEVAVTVMGMDVMVG